MPFDPDIFEAEIALGMIPSERMPAVAQDAMEAGFDGRALVRMAILDAPTGWEVDQILPNMLAELGRGRIGAKDAAIALAKARARQILDKKDDPLQSITYFYRLMWKADYPEELIELGYLDDFLTAEYSSDEERRAYAFEAIENLFDPALGLGRKRERERQWEEQRRQILNDWPYVLNSVGGRREYWKRWRCHWVELRWLFVAQVALILGVGWMVGPLDVWAWFLLLLPLMALLQCVVLWRRMRYEVQALRWRQRIDL